MWFIVTYLCSKIRPLQRAAAFRASSIASGVRAQIALIDQQSASTEAEHSSIHKYVLGCESPRRRDSTHPQQPFSQPRQPGRARLRFSGSEHLSPTHEKPDQSHPRSYLSRPDLLNPPVFAKPSHQSHFRGPAHRCWGALSSSDRRSSTGLPMLWDRRSFASRFLHVVNSPSLRPTFRTP